EQHAGGTVAKGIVDRYPTPVPPRVIELTTAAVRRLLGMAFPVEEMKRVLGSLEFKVEQAGPDSLRVTVPPNRVDIQEGVADLVEELVRVYGYDRLPATLLADQLPEQYGDVELRREERVRDLLV